MKPRCLTAGSAIAALIIAVLPGPGCSPPEQETLRHNVLLITLDTTRADRLSLYGYDRPTSGNLDALAESSIVFDMAIAQAAVTPVSHASILTGLNPYHHGLRVLHGDVAYRLEEEQTTLAEVWRAAGGETAAFVSAYPVTKAFGLDQGFRVFHAEFPQMDRESMQDERGLVYTGESQCRADVTTDAAIEWLKGRARSKRPFLLWVHYFDPHDPGFWPPEAYVRPLLAEGFEPLSFKQGDRLRAIYDIEIRFMDDQIGRLFGELKQHGMWDETIIVVVADHGEGLGDHDWWTHGILYQEQIRVPMLIRIPGMEGGKRVESLVRTMDLMPTILEAAGVDSALYPIMDGESLIETMRTGKTPRDLPGYSDAINLLNYRRLDIEDGIEKRTDKLYALIEGRYKLIYHQIRPEESEFYDLVDDPHESNDLARQDPPAQMQALIDRLHEMDVFSDIMPGMTPTELERLRRLRSLGYIE